MRRPGFEPVTAPLGSCSAEGGGGHTGEACGSPALLPPRAPGFLAPGAPPLLHGVGPARLGRPPGGPDPLGQVAGTACMGRFSTLTFLTIALPMEG